MRSLAVATSCLALILAGCSAGTHQSAADPAAATPQTTTSFPDWPTYHGNFGRTGVSTSMPAAGTHLTLAKSIKLDGAVYASPLVARGNTIIATENNSVYAYSGTNTLLWHTNLGKPSPASERPCGDIDPLGITGTPVYDPTEGAHGTLYVSPELAGPPHHQLVGLDPVTGKVLWRVSVDLSGVDAIAMQERGALTIASGRVWVPFGGLAGDCGAYKGRLVGVPRDGTGHRLVYTAETTREAGIWTPPGPTINAGHLYVALGNGESGVGDKYDFSDSILRIGSTTGTRIGSFSPTTWASDNDADLDLGSQGPAIVDNKWVFADGKSSTAYVLNLSRLGGIGGQVSKATICRSFGGTAVSGSTVYVPCTDGIRAVTISSTGTMHVAWQAGSSVIGSPVVGGGRLWAIDNAGSLMELSPSTGATVAHIAIGSTNRFATPALSGNRIIVGTLTGFVIVTTS